VILGNRRLSILDLPPAGHQPMATDDGGLVVTFNGEIYNFEGLRDELAREGRRFRGGSDTEVLLHAYRAWGIECLERLDGMFAFALWDRRRGELLLARGRIGIKPLFYWQGADGALAFASELKPLLLVPGLGLRVNRRAPRSALKYASNLEEESMVAGVHKLPPGDFLRWRDGEVARGTYWRHPAAAPAVWSADALTAELRRRLRHAVSSHLVSDARVRTFTVGHGLDDPDLVGARRVAEHCGTDHREIVVGAEDARALLPTIVWHLEEPLGHPETVQLYAT
jgi:asparagine synthase (glutamine-hydrolysing)